MQNEQNSQPAAMTDEQLAIVVEQARLATDSHCDGLPHEPTKEYSDAYFARALLSQAQVAQPVSEQNARFAIEAAIDFGRANTNPPPSEDHWLMPFWKIGRQMGDAPESKLTDAEIDGVWRQMPGGPEGWLKEFGYIHFARAIEERLLAAAPVEAQPQAKCHWNRCPHGAECVHAEQPQAAGQARELPPLPFTTYNGYSDGSEPLYTANQMHDYARAAQAAPASDRIKELEQKLIDLRVKYEVACSTLDIVKEQRTAAQKALAAQCKAAQAAPSVAVAAREPGDSDNLSMALQAAYRLLDGSQPIDIAGARMVLQSALKAVPTAWSYDISPPQGFIDYVRKNYSGDVCFHDPAWHALRLWNAAMKNAKPPVIQAHTVAASAQQEQDRRDAADHVESLGLEFFHGPKEYAAASRRAVANAIRAAMTAKQDGGKA